MDYVVALGRRQRKRQAVHQRLLDIAQELYRERGIAATTVDDIAEAADVARQTFFNHFPYKEALAVELGSEGIQDVAQHAQALLEAGVPALDVLRHAAELVLESALRDGELAVVVARELLHPDRERAGRAAQQFPLREFFEAILGQARDEGAVRADLPLDIVASTIATTVRQIILHILCKDEQRLRCELHVSFDIVFNGIVDRSK